MITARAFAGRHYALYGLARSGIAAAKALLASGAKVTAWDTREEARAKAPPGTQIKYLDEMELSGFDSLVVTPGLPINRHPIAKRALEAGVEIIGDIELFARARGELPPHKVVGITGTNGKSTTTALVHHVLQTAGVPSAMGGNIGEPILSLDPLPKGGVYVLELSSFQIDLTKSLDCDVAVLLNITPDHLDRYESFEAYRDSKLRMFQLQSDKSVGVIASLDNNLIERVLNTLPRPDEVAHPVLPFEIAEHYIQGEAPTLQGPHNAQNLWATMQAVEALGLPLTAFENGAKTFPGLPHRMERVGEKGGVLFVNDSKATNPTATAPALAAFEGIRWICGGQAKTDNLDECAPFFGHVAKAYTIGEAGELFERLLKPHMPVKNCGKLDSAVSEAAKDSTPGDIVLLSPACASFDQFRDFEDRGDRFRAAVGAI